ncbi:SURF1 family protein [Vibrio renipiscarius]|uniref:SURF1 family protein n=1 Tax=Vibrio renipiscarius TaxID=1461322 RepID=UPI00354BF571
MAAISILVNLGFWQLSRAEEKQAIQDLLQRNQTQTAVALSSVIESVRQSPNGVDKGLTGRPVYFHSMPVKGRYLLLDNQIVDGKVGYLALQLMQTLSGHFVLLERGFVEGDRNRAILPSVDWLNQAYNGEGRVYFRSINPLSQQLMHENTQPMRVQNLNIDELSDLWQINIEAFVIQPQKVGESWPYVQPWQPIPMKANKHIGYAVQWFCMAFALGVLAFIWFYLALKKQDRI